MPTLLPTLMLLSPAGALPAGTVDVWLDLDLPALATLPQRPAGERDTQRERIRAQQDAVMAQLAPLGGRELGRVQLLRNALAVRLPVDQLDAVRRLPGVRAVRAVHDTRPHVPRIEP